jgi:hypothetical protein
VDFAATHVYRRLPGLVNIEKTDGKSPLLVGKYVTVPLET